MNTLVLISALLIVVIILIYYYYWVYKGSDTVTPATDIKENMKSDLPKSIVAKVQTKEDRIQSALRENFAVCNTDNSTVEDTCTSDLQFAKNPFGAAGVDYNTFAASQVIDNNMIKNHATFIKERRGNNPKLGAFTGRTYSPTLLASEGIETDYIPWVGLRRPMAVAGMKCDPTQDQDVPDTYFTSGRKFTLNT